MRWQLAWEDFLFGGGVVVHDRGRVEFAVKRTVLAITLAPSSCRDSNERHLSFFPFQSQASLSISQPGFFNSDVSLSFFTAQLSSHRPRRHLSNLPSPSFTSSRNLRLQLPISSLSRSIHPAWPLSINWVLIILTAFADSSKSRALPSRAICP
jgi:hypothetical protein